MIGMADHAQSKDPFHADSAAGPARSFPLNTFLRGSALRGGCRLPHTTKYFAPG